MGAMELIQMFIFVVVIVLFALWAAIHIGDCVLTIIETGRSEVEELDIKEDWR